jgi:hypothetical protein
MKTSPTITLISIMGRSRRILASNGSAGRSGLLNPHAKSMPGEILKREYRNNREPGPLQAPGLSLWPEPNLD